jgi:hypothetical protein
MPVSGLGQALQVMLGACAAAAFIHAGASAALAVALAEYDGSTDYTLVPLTTSDVIDGAASMALLAAYAPCIVTFVVWLFRVRHNAEVMCKAQHRRARGWIVAGWIVPIVNLWFPKQIVDDIWLASDPMTDAGRHTLEGLPRHGLVTAWWLCWITSLLLDRAAARTITAASSVDDGQTGAVLNSVTGALLVAAATLAIAIIRRITAYQRQRSTDHPSFASGPWPVPQP